MFRRCFLAATAGVLGVFCSSIVGGRGKVSENKRKFIGVLNYRTDNRVTMVTISRNPLGLFDNGWCGNLVIHRRNSLVLKSIDLNPRFIHLQDQTREKFYEFYNSLEIQVGDVIELSIQNDPYIHPVAGELIGTQAVLICVG